MKHIVVASQNPVKVEAARRGFKRMFPEEEFDLVEVNTPSGVSVQPLSDDETRTGALNRARGAARAAEKQGLPADYYVGIEGGVEDIPVGQGGLPEMAVFAWIVITSSETAGLVGQGRTATFFLPPKITTMVREGKELGEADDIFFERTNSKQGNGAIGILSGNVIDRVELYVPAVIMALLPFKNLALYYDKIVSSHKEE